ncbi:MAG: pyridine nucleotide-disulfide oxidoreductase, partial [Candidatus Dadabacteria bacterium]
MELRIEGFTYGDLYDPGRLAELDGHFRKRLAENDPELAKRFEAYRAGAELGPVEESELLIAVARHLSRFLAWMFGIEDEAAALRDKIRSYDPIWKFKKEFPGKRAKRVRDEELEGFDADAFDRVVSELAAWRAERPGAPEDEEARFAAAVLELLEGGEQERARLGAELQERLRGLWPLPEDGAEVVEHLLVAVARWCRVRAAEPGPVAGWGAFKVPKPVDYGHLVDYERTRPDFPEFMEGPRDRRRRRDGFKLTDRRYSEKQVLSEVDYCVLCHNRNKDSCTKGVRDKSGQIATNPLGIKLAGCPLDEKISEMHTLHGEGDPIGALALIAIDNPMVAGTGHRICNDCMKACIYQKYDPVNIPQIETRVLVDVLGLRWGMEIYSLLTRWNPLNRRRPVPLPYNGKNVLVVGLGPAGYTLAHYLLGEGFGVVAIDGLKIEPLEPELARDENGNFKPVERFFDYYQELDERPLMGFGGVAEYGITVRWDKNFLKVIRLLLDRRRHFRSYGGVRFGGTITIDDAWALGFDHIAIATGAGKPTIVPMKNNLVRGIRKASDFLMALQLTGAQKKGSMANLQVRLPAIVIGGGLTAIDTTTEVMAYYPMQVEKTLERYEKLVAERGEQAVRAAYPPDELEILDEFLEHGRAVRAERERAAAAGEEPDFAKLVHSWGGATMVYRKSMLDSPAYRLNHEEIIKAFEEGIWYAEKLAPVEALRGKDGALDGVV